jgi:hypothetical protein
MHGRLNVVLASGRTLFLFCIAAIACIAMKSILFERRSINFPLHLSHLTSWPARLVLVTLLNLS